MNQKVKLAELFGQRKLLRLLALFLETPAREWTQREIRQAAKLAKPTMVKWLAELVRQRLIRLTKKGNVHLYTLSRDDAIVKQLKILTTLLELRELAALRETHGCEVYLYGSAARGEDTEESDIDILVIGKATPRDIAPFLEPIAKRTAKVIRPQLFTAIAWSQMARKDPAFYQRVAKDRISLA